MTEEVPPDVDFSEGNGEYVIERLSEKAVFVGGGPNRYWVEWTEDGLRIRTDGEFVTKEDEFKEMLEDRIQRAVEGESASHEEVKEVFSDVEDEDTLLDSVNIDEHMDDLLDGEAVEEAVVEQTIRENEPLTYKQLMEELGEGGSDVLGVLGRLFEQGDIYEPQRGELRVVSE